MIVVRDVFRIRPTEMKAAKTAVREMRPLSERLGLSSQRAMTDLVGPSYTLVLESLYPSLSDLEKALARAFADPDWQAAYARLRPLVEGGHREVYSLLE